jgi:hypothetical protein
MNTTKTNANNALHSIINWRGQREQAKFAVKYYQSGVGKHLRGAYTRGCEIFTPIRFALKGVDLSDALIIDRAYNGEQLIEDAKQALMGWPNHNYCPSNIEF